MARVNRPGKPDDREGMERHHLIVTQCLRDRAMRAFFDELAPYGFRLSDFATNGILLPAWTSLGERLSLPVHRGPHPRYSSQVITHVEGIVRASRWIDGSQRRARFAIGALRAAQRRLRAAIACHGAGSIDDISIAWRGDMEVEAAIHALRLACTEHPVGCGHRVAERRVPEDDALQIDASEVGLKPFLRAAA